MVKKCILESTMGLIFREPTSGEMQSPITSSTMTHGQDLNFIT